MIPKSLFSGLIGHAYLKRIIKTAACDDAPCLQRTLRGRRAGVPLVSYHGEGYAGPERSSRSSGHNRSQLIYDQFDGRTRPYHLVRHRLQDLPSMGQAVRDDLIWID